MSVRQESRIWPSQFGGDEDALARFVVETFRLDAVWRDQCTGGPSGYAECVRLYELQGGPASGTTDIPELPNIRGPVDDAVSFAVGSATRTRLQVVQPIPMDLDEDVRDVIRFQHQKSAEVIDRHCETILHFNSIRDLRGKALKQAGIFGMGCLLVELDPNVDTRHHLAAGRLMRKHVSHWTERDWRAYGMIQRWIRVQFVDTRDLFFMRGVKSYYEGSEVSDQMLRASTLEIVNVDDLKMQYPEHADHLKPGFGKYHIDQYKSYNASHRTTGVINMWHLEPDFLVMGVQEEGKPPREVGFRGYKLHKMKVSSGRMLQHEVYDGDLGTAPVSLPFVPFYIYESENHPYGHSLARVLKTINSYISGMQTLMFEQARKAASPQSFAILASMLDKADDIDDMVEKLRNGDPIMLYGNKNVTSIDQVLQPTGQLVAGLSTAPLQAIEMAKGMMKEYTQQIDRSAVARAESGRGKEMEFLAADQTKAPVVDIVARSDQWLKDLVRLNVSVHHSVPMEVPILKGMNGYDMVMLNRTREEIILSAVDDPVTGLPLQDPSFVSHDNPFGFVFDRKRFELVENNVQLELRAIAEGRGDLPTSWQARLRLFANLLSLGALQSPRTMRDLSLPEEISVIDDKNAAEDAQAAQAAQAAQQQAAQQQAAQQQALQSALSGAANPGASPPSSTEPAAASVRSALVNQRNAQIGRAAPPANDFIRDAAQARQQDTALP